MRFLAGRTERLRPQTRSGRPQEMRSFERRLTERLGTLFPGADLTALAHLYELRASSREARMGSVEEQWLR